MAEHLIQSYGDLLDVQGKLREPGYALKPPFVYDRGAITAAKWRIKEWDYYLINDDERALALTFSDLGYVGMVSASVMDFEARSSTTSSKLLMLPLGRMGLPSSSDTGDICWSGKGCRVEFCHVDAGRRLSFYLEGFDGSSDLEAELLLTKEPRDSMVIATPWDEDEKAFYYNRKIVGMQAQGGFRIGEKFHEFKTAANAKSGESFGLLDWGRGVWTYDNTWFWAIAQGRQGEHVLGLNLGYGFGNTTAASENVIFVDGVAHKLDRCDFGIGRTAAGGWRYMEPWHMSEENGRIELLFTPEIDRSDLIDLAGIIRTEQHQIFGMLDGFVVLDDGSRIEITGLRCAGERVHNKY